MLVVDLTWACRRSQQPAAARIVIRNVGGGRLADYAIEAYGHRDVLLCRTEFRRYPRWAEPVSALVARTFRCVSTALPAFYGGRARVVAAIARTSLVPCGQWARAKRLASMSLTVNKNEFVTARVDESPLPVIRRSFRHRAADTDPLQLLMRVVARALWRRDELAPAPGVPQLPTFTAGSRTYIRLSDIPVWAAPAFMQQAGGWKVVVPREAVPCYDARAWDLFLGPTDYIAGTQDETTA